MARVEAYPWAALGRVSRRAARLGGHARRLVDRHVRFGELRQALESVIGAQVELNVERIELCEPASLGALVTLEAGSLELGLTVEPELASAVLARIIGRTAAIGPNGLPLDPTLSGALAAIVIEVARRTQGAPPLRVAAGADATLGEAVVVDATLVLERQSYAISGWTRPGELAPQSRPVSLGTLGEIPIGLPLVVGTSVARREELESLRPGDAWLPGPGLWIDGRGKGRGVLAAPRSECGPGVDFLEDGRIVLRGESVGLAADLDEEMAEPDDTQAGGVEATALEAPLVVRVEICSVSMKAREWAELKRGDVIETGRKIGEKVVLRVAGREVARGDLVSVDGELGVRVSEILGEERGR